MADRGYCFYEISGQAVEESSCLGIAMQSKSKQQVAVNSSTYEKLSGNFFMVNFFGNEK